MLKKVAITVAIVLIAPIVGWVVLVEFWYYMLLAVSGSEIFAGASTVAAALLLGTGLICWGICWWID